LGPANCQRTSRGYSKTAGREKIAQGYEKRNGEWVLRKDVENLQNRVLQLRENLSQLKSFAPKTKDIDTEITNLQTELKEYELAIKDMPLGDFAVPSFIARILPRGVREHLYKTYRHEGDFLGSDGFINLCLNDFNAANNILANARTRHFSLCLFLSFLALL